MKYKFITGLLTAMLVLAVFSACSSDSDKKSTEKSMDKSMTTMDHSASKTETVNIKTFMFDPNPVEVKVGTKITWKNMDEINHTVTSGNRDNPDGKFDGLLKDKGTSYSHTFDKAGTFEYHCEIHPGMDAKVEVTN